MYNNAFREPHNPFATAAVTAAAVIYRAERAQ